MQVCTFLPDEHLNVQEGDKAWARAGEEGKEGNNVLSSASLHRDVSLQTLCPEGNPQAFLSRGDDPPNGLAVDIEQGGNVVLGQMADGLRRLPMDQSPETLLEDSNLLSCQPSARGQLGEPLEIQRGRTMLIVELDHQRLAAGKFPHMFPEGCGEVEVVERGCSPYRYFLPTVI